LPCCDKSTKTTANNQDVCLHILIALESKRNLSCPTAASRAADFCRRRKSEG
jgi:hypothetical protein